MLRASIKQLRNQLFRSPNGAQMSPGAQVIRPFRVIGGSHLSIGRDTFIGSDSFIAAYKEHNGRSYRPKIEIGSGVYIGTHLYLTAVTEVAIADGCVLSEYVYLTDTYHEMHPAGGPIMAQPLGTKGPVRIGANCFLGFRSCIMPGVTLGPNCIVGANAVVSKSFPGFVMLAGVPARVIKVFCAEKSEWVLPADAVSRSTTAKMAISQESDDRDR